MLPTKLKHWSLEKTVLNSELIEVIFILLREDNGSQSQKIHDKMLFSLRNHFNVILSQQYILYFVFVNCRNDLYAYRNDLK